MLDRRAFLAACSRLGLTTTLLPGVLWAMADEKGTAKSLEMRVAELEDKMRSVHITEDEMKAAQQVSLGDLRDPLARNANLDANAPATDENRTRPGKEQWLVMVQVCTHLGCVPLGHEGDYAGWFCPCHGSQYDTSGRIRKGPAPVNLEVPPYEFASDTMIRIG